MWVGGLGCCDLECGAQVYRTQAGGEVGMEVPTCCRVRNCGSAMKPAFLHPVYKVHICYCALWMEARACRVGLHAAYQTFERSCCTESKCGVTLMGAELEIAITLSSSRSDEFLRPGLRAEGSMLGLAEAKKIGEVVAFRASCALVPR